MMQIFTEILKEYFEYVKTADQHKDSPIDGYVIMGECFDELPSIVSDSFADRVLNSYHTDFDGKVSMDPKTIKQIICAIALTMEQTEIRLGKM